ncbi:hypothetical protein TWF281_006174 [Arthrobotrys megalospora]
MDPAKPNSISPLIESPPPPIHSDSSHLRPHVKPIKELRYPPTTTSPSNPFDLGIDAPTAPETPDMRASPAPPFPTGGTATSSFSTAQKTVIGLSVGVIVALILTATVIYFTLLKCRRIQKKDEEATATGAAEAAKFESGGQDDSDPASPPPPRYSLQDPSMGDIVLPPKYLESGKDGEKQEKDVKHSEVEETKEQKRSSRGSSVSPVRNMRILV